MNYPEVVFDASKDKQGLKATFNDQTIYATLVQNQTKKAKENLSMNRKKEQISEDVL